MKTIKLCCFLLLIASFACNDEKPIKKNDKQYCNEAVFNSYKAIIENGKEFDKDPSIKNCNALKEAAKKHKEKMIECSLWENESQKAKMEIEDIMNRKC